jgi:hypothetical protein
MTGYSHSRLSTAIPRASPVLLLNRKVAQSMNRDAVMRAADTRMRLRPLISSDRLASGAREKIVSGLLAVGS